MLTNVKSRGTWAEAQRGNILDQTVPGMYDTNVATNPKYNGRVENAVRIPAAAGSGHAWQPIESKFPKEDYARLTAAAQAGDRQGMESAQKALEQRTALLREAKRGITPDPVLLDTFEEAMATPCGIIMPLRDKLVKQLAKIAAEKYERISGRPNEMFRMTYQPCVAETSNPVPAIRAELKKSRQEDIRVGGAGCGIHREDIGLSLMGRSMKVFASQGQIRTAALAIKLAQLEAFRAETGETPRLLLDDVMSELDMTRRTRLLREIEGVQTFITCTDESDLDGCREKRSYRVWMASDGEGHDQEESAGDEVMKPDLLHAPVLDEQSGK